MDEVKKVIIGNATPTPPPRPDWNQDDENRGDYIKNKPTLGSLAGKSIVTRTDLDEEIQESLDKVDDAIAGIGGGSTPKEVIHLANGRRIESRENGVYIVTENPEIHEEPFESLLVDEEGSVNAFWADIAGEADTAVYAMYDMNSNPIEETYATKEELSAPKEIIHLTNGMSIRARNGDGVYIVTNDPEQYEVPYEFQLVDFEGNVNAMWAEYAGEADYAAYADCDAEGNNIPETYATKEELTEPKEVIHLANGMRIESREEGIYLVSPEDREQEIEECSYLLINKYDAITDLVAKYAEFAYETEYALYAEHSATADMDSEERTLKGVYIEELDLDEAIDISEIEIFDGYIASLGLVNRPLEILLPPEKQYQYVGFTSAMYFATPSEIPENYTQFPDVIHFKGDSVVDGRLVPEPNMRYTIVFDFDGYMLNAYVSGVTTV